MLIKQGQTDHKTAIEIESDADKQADRQDILKRGKVQEKKEDILDVGRRQNTLKSLTKNGVNIVQWYGQKICLKSAVLDFPGRNLHQTACKTSRAYPSCQRGAS